MDEKIEAKYMGHVSAFIFVISKFDKDLDKENIFPPISNRAEINKGQTLD